MPQQPPNPSPSPDGAPTRTIMMHPVGRVRESMIQVQRRHPATYSTPPHSIVTSPPAPRIATHHPEPYKIQPATLLPCYTCPLILLQLAPNNKHALSRCSVSCDFACAREVSEFTDWTTGSEEDVDFETVANLDMSLCCARETIRN